jgi:hypothetical protein
MQLVRESGVAQRLIVARLAGFPASRRGIFRPWGTAPAAAIVAPAIAKRASILYFTTSTGMLGRKIVPPRIELRRRSTPGSKMAVRHAGTCAATRFPWFTHKFAHLSRPKAV